MTTKRRTIYSAHEARQVVLDHLDQDFAFDVETTGLSYRHDRLLGLALTFETGDSYYICLEHTIRGEQATNERLPTESYIPYEAFRKAVSPLFSQHDPLMVAHNAKFDLHFLKRHNIAVQGRLADTMLAAKLLDENREGGLKELAWLVGMDLSPYHELQHYKGYRKEEYLGVPLDIASNYAMLDTEATYALWKHFAPQLTEQGLDYVYKDVWMPLLVTLQEMEAKGIALDLDQVTRVREEYVARAAVAEEAIWRVGIEMVLEKEKGPDPLPDYYLRQVGEEEDIIESDDGSQWIEERGIRLPAFLPTPRSKKLRTYTFNPSSSNQLNALLYDWMGLRPPEGWKLTTKEDGSYSSDKNTLKLMDMALEDESPPILKDILELRKTEKMIGTYLDRFLEDADRDDHNAIHTSFNQTVAATGRLSSSNPNLNFVGR